MMKEVWEKRRVSQNTLFIQESIKNLKVVYADLDSTLLGPGGSLFLSSNCKLTLEPAKAILKCHKHQIDITFVSGRNSIQLFEVARILGVKNFLSELGCEITYNLGEKVLYNIEGFNTKEDYLPIDKINESGVLELLFSKYKGFLEYHEPWEKNRQTTTLLRGFVNVDEVNSFLNEYSFEWLEIVDNGVIKRRGTCNPDIKEIHAYHLIFKGCGKFSGVIKDREIRSIKKENCIAIGDSISDMEIADAVGIFFLVKNGLLNHPDLLQKIANKNNVFITEKEMGLGFAEVINLFLQK
jgi:hydroxymethylpyrimidine pyrophosphatase-like HAD family hydrolase